MNTLGISTVTILFAGFHANALHQSLEAAADVVKGQPVKLNNAGQVEPLVSGDAPTLQFGIALMDALANELTTVVTRGLGIIIGKSDAAQNAGYVKVKSFATPYTKYEASAAADMHGWSLDAAVGADEDIRIVVPN